MKATSEPNRGAFKVRIGSLLGDDYHRDVMVRFLTGPVTFEKAARLWLATVALVCFVASPVLANQVPKGGCPQPIHTLVVNEIHVGAQLMPRWLELRNPGLATISLKNVVVRVTAKGIGKSAGATSDVLEFSIDTKISSLPPSAVAVFGHVPGYDEGKGGKFLGFQLFDLGGTFQLPPCLVKVQIIGPKGPIDTVQYDLCKGSGQATASIWQTVLSLDPAHSDICANDSQDVWCKATQGGVTGPSPGGVNKWCDLDGDGYTKDTGDCDDDSKMSNPSAIEVCNGLDDNCNGKTDEGAVAPLGTCLSLGICTGPLADGSAVTTCAGNSGWVCNYPLSYESVNETECDYKDNDCDGETDEGLRNACGTCAAADQLAEVCDGKDNDCDGLTDEDVELAKSLCAGSGVCEEAIAACDPVKGLTCLLPAAYEVTETLCDGLDNDCDDLTDEEMGLGQKCVVGVGQCSRGGKLTCSLDQVVCFVTVGSPEQEQCGDGVDNDCDGMTDEGFGIGEQCSVGMGVCQVSGKRVCAADGLNSICVAKLGPPEDSEVCGNGLDDDCDGEVDEKDCVDGEGAGGFGSCTVDRSHRGRSHTGWLLLVSLLALVTWRRSRAGSTHPDRA